MILDIRKKIPLILTETYQEARRFEHGAQCDCVLPERMVCKDARGIAFAFCVLIRNDLGEEA